MHSIFYCIHALQYGYTPLHRAVTDDKMDVVKIMLSHGANVDTESCDVCELSYHNSMIFIL